MRSFLCLSLAAAIFSLTGCALQTTATPSSLTGPALQGRVHGGQQPVSGAHIYLLAANTTGYGGNGIAPSSTNASISLLNASATGNSDSLGAFVLSAADGTFTISGDYTCTSGQQVYLYALGGNPGAGPNSAVGLMAAVGSCPTSSAAVAALPIIQINEVTTVAAAYAFAGFASDATHVSSSGTTLAQTGIANAFLNAANLASLTTGQALTKLPGGTGVVPQSRINTLADILSTCINSTSSNASVCSTLMANTLSAGSTGTTPTDTATAAINIAHNPGANVATLYGLVTANNPFSPSLATQPADFSIALALTGGGLGTSQAIAIDANGNAWITNTYGSSVSEIASNGIPISPATGFTTPDMLLPTAVAIDSHGNVWVGNDNGDHNGRGTYTLSELSSQGVTLSGTLGFSGGGLDNPRGIAIDSNDNVWTANNTTTGDNLGDDVSEFSNSGMPLSPSAVANSSRGGYSLGQTPAPTGIAIDATGNVWVSGQAAYGMELSNSGTLLSPGGNSTTPGYQNVGQNAAGVAITPGGAWFAGYSNLTEASSTGALISPSQGVYSTGTINIVGIAADGAGNLWTVSDGSSNLNANLQNISAFSPSGAVMTPQAGFHTTYMYNPSSIAIDGSGNVWVPDQYYATVLEFIGAAVPVVTPISAGVRNNTIASRP
jgi:hypothetical protein